MPKERDQEGQKTGPAVDTGLQRILQKISVPLTVADPGRPDQPLIAANAAFAQICGYDEHRIIGRNCRFLQDDLENGDARAEIRSGIATRKRTQTILRNRHADGTVFNNYLTIVPIPMFESEDILMLGAQFILTDAEAKGLEDIRPAQHDTDLAQSLSRLRMLMVERRRVNVEAAVRLVQSHILIHGLDTRRD